MWRARRPGALKRGGHTNPVRAPRRDPSRSHETDTILTHGAPSVAQLRACPAEARMPEVTFTPEFMYDPAPGQMKKDANRPVFRKMSVCGKCTRDGGRGRFVPSWVWFGLRANNVRRRNDSGKMGESPELCARPCPARARLTESAPPSRARVCFVASCGQPARTGRHCETFREHHPRTGGFTCRL
jgi:hypothetical protein